MSGAVSGSCLVRKRTTRLVNQPRGPAHECPPLPLQAGEGRGEGAVRGFRGALRAQSPEHILPQGVSALRFERQWVRGLRAALEPGWSRPPFNLDRAGVDPAEGSAVAFVWAQFVHCGYDPLYLATIGFRKLFSCFGGRDRGADRSRSAEFIPPHTLEHCARNKVQYLITVVSAHSTERDLSQVAATTQARARWNVPWRTRAVDPLRRGTVRGPSKTELVFSDSAAVTQTKAPHGLKPTAQMLLAAIVPPQPAAQCERWFLDPLEFRIRACRRAGR